MSELWRFEKRVLLFVLPLLAVVTACAVYFAFFSRHHFLYETLYRYQLEKIRKVHGVETILVGDSSLGNAIDAELFSHYTSTRSLNLALTGLYGYAGSYNMIKRAHRANPGLRNVIVMHSLDMLQRETSFRGYLYTMERWADIGELSNVERTQVALSGFEVLASQVLGALTRRRLSPQQVDLSGDYVRQAPRRETGPPAERPSPERFEAASINPDKTRFLRKISRYCEAHELRLFYVHGPYALATVRISDTYIAAANEQIELAGVPNLVTEVVAIPPADRGDSRDHVRPRRRACYTEKFSRLLRLYAPPVAVDPPQACIS